MSVKAVPNYIKKKLHLVASYSNSAAYTMKEVEEWLERQGFNIEALRNGDGCSLEEFEYGNDITDEFCAKIDKILEQRTKPTFLN